MSSYLLLVTKGLIERLILGARILKIKEYKGISDCVPYVKYIKGAMYDEKTAKRKTKLLITAGFIFAGGEYVVYTHISEVPITHRKRMLLFNDKKEIELKKLIKDDDDKEEEGKGKVNTNVAGNSLDFRYAIIYKVIDALKRACVYYSPESKEFFDQLDVSVVENEEINAMAMIGGSITVYTGIVDYYMKQNDDFLVVEAAVASVIAHEMGHLLAHHSMEEIFHISNLFFYSGIFLFGDFFILPAVKKMFNNRLSCHHENEADLIGMYLMKRAGYSPEMFINTIENLPPPSLSFNKTINSVLSTHPIPSVRAEFLRENLPKLEEEYKSIYSIEKPTFVQNISTSMKTIQSYIAYLFC